MGLARFRYPVGLSFFIMFMYFPPVCSDTFLMPRRTLGMQPFGAGRKELGIVLTHDLVSWAVNPSLTAFTQRTITVTQ